MTKMNDRLEMPGTVSRRSFLLGLSATAAVVAGSSLTGCAPQSPAPAASVPQGDGTENLAGTGDSIELLTDTVQDALAKPAKNQESKEADIVVIGSGIAGMSCAVEASLAGAKVVIL